MGKHEKVLKRVLIGESDHDISFEVLRNLLLYLGFVERTRGSHHIYRKEGVRELLNLQRDGSLAKAYQVREVRNVIRKYRLDIARNV